MTTLGHPVPLTLQVSVRGRDSLAANLVLWDEAVDQLVVLLPNRTLHHLQHKGPQKALEGTCCSEANPEDELVPPEDEVTEHLEAGKS